MSSAEAEKEELTEAELAELEHLADSEGDVGKIARAWLDLEEDSNDRDR